MANQDRITRMPGPRQRWNRLPGSLRDVAERALSAYDERARSQGWPRAADPHFRAGMGVALACSEFLSDLCEGRAEVIAELLASGDLLRDYGPTRERAFGARLDNALADVAEETELLPVLRRYRQREMARIALRDLAGWTRLDETLADLSTLAEVTVRGTLARLEAWAAEEYGVPHSADQKRQSMVVLALGKLGAAELNFSSDIDLLFTYPEEGETQGGSRQLANEEFFTRVGQRLIRALDESTTDGFVFRVDMRLRPFGDAGPLALSFDALESYYQTHGREWERYALIKARPIAGPVAARDALMASLRPFVFRRYLDFGAFEALRDLKSRIAGQVNRKGRRDDIKLGPGGIREVEFIGQAFQLIRGGRERQLQQRGIISVLGELGRRGYLPPYEAEELTASYRFLRDTENRLQMMADQQTQRLPRNETGRLRLAHAMGYARWDTFSEALAEHRERVHSYFEQVFEAPQSQDQGGQAIDYQGLWRGTVGQEQGVAMLADAGYGKPEAALDALTALRDSGRIRALEKHGADRLDRLMPLLLGAVAEQDDPDATLPRLLQLISDIARRAAYLALLVENPMALSQVVQLCGASPWIANQLSHHPILLDELLDPRTLYHPLERDALGKELEQWLERMPADDLEARMDTLRHFKQAQVLRVAAGDLLGGLPLMKVSDHLTWIAEVVLEQALRTAWADLVRRHGPPPGTGETHPGFIVVGYGKLGGYELGYGSDLDIVFIHDHATGETDGEKPVSVDVFYARLGQRIIHILDTFTPAGMLYEVDVRLRPEGKSGLLVTPLEAFESYQEERAWTWEHQALVRARPVAGDPQLGERFRALREQLLGRPRDPETLRQAVTDMREKMYRNLAKEGAGEFDLKQGRGGIADIEFMVQYMTLRWGHDCGRDHPGLLRWTDNIRLLESLAEAGAMTPNDAEALAEAYRSLRGRIHRQALAERSNVEPADAFAGERETVQRLWNQYMAP